MWKRKQIELDSESDEEDADFQKKTGNKKRKYKLKDKNMEKIVADLKEKLGSTYTALQCYHIYGQSLLMVSWPMQVSPVKTQCCPEQGVAVLVTVHKRSQKL